MTEAAIDGAMARAADAVDKARSRDRSAGPAMLAMVEQSQAALRGRPAPKRPRALAERLDMAGSKIEMLAGQLGQPDAASRTLLGGMARRSTRSHRRSPMSARAATSRMPVTQSMDGAARRTAAGLRREIGHGQAQCRRAHRSARRGAEPRAAGRRRPRGTARRNAAGRWPGSRSRPSAPRPPPRRSCREDEKLGWRTLAPMPPPDARREAEHGRASARRSTRLARRR